MAVAADIRSGKTIKLGKNIHYTHCQSSRNCTKLWKEHKLWKLKKIKSRERKTFKSALNAISRQIVSFAESLGSGIKFERLFSPRYSHRPGVVSSYEFSFENGSFFTVRQQVEKRAWVRGILVIRYTSRNVAAGVAFLEGGFWKTFRVPALRVYDSQRSKCRVQHCNDFIAQRSSGVSCTTGKFRTRREKRDAPAEPNPCTYSAAGKDHQQEWFPCANLPAVPKKVKSFLVIVKYQPLA